ncbi:MAG TPA: sulfatase-like hydrolase/transferase [Armatimonadota bacterium]|jgi:uncharacterized sulfatase
MSENNKGALPPVRKIVIIMTDTQRTDMLGCYGNPDMQTPCLDRLAATGIRFDRAYTCQPVCGPARAALFTGAFPHSNGSWANCMPLGDNVTTLGQRLRDQGLHTAYIGKWHLDGGDYFGVGRCPDGWDDAYWYDMRCYLEELTPEERLRSRQTTTNMDPDLRAEFTFGHRVSDRAIDFLATSGTDDFLLVVSYDEPHHPYLCPPPFSAMYRDYVWPKRKQVCDRLDDKPEHQQAWAGARRWEDEADVTITPADYLGCNAFVDQQIGRVLDAVDRYAPDALVIYTADHGDFLGAHRLDNKGAAMYDEITNVPLLVRWPGVAPAGTICPHPVSHIDVVPTVLAAAGLPLPALLEGRSLCHTLADPSVRENEAVFMEFGRYEVDHDSFGGFQPIRCACDGRYKLVINLLATDELYDLETDPDELYNLIASAPHAATRDALHDTLLAWMNRTRDPFRGYYWERRPWRADARPATWNYTGMTRQRENEEYEPRQLDYDTGLPMVSAVRGKE